jgi:hypothetical protein
MTGHNNNIKAKKESSHHIGVLEWIQKLRSIQKFVTNSKEQERTKEEIPH